MPLTASERALELLGWPELLSALAARAQTPGGQERALALPFLDGRVEVETAQLVVADALGRLDEGAAVHLGGAEDVGPQLDLAEKEGVLDGLELWRVRSTLVALRDLAAFCREHGEAAPHLTARGRGLSDHEALLLRLDRCLEPTGELSDDASDRLRQARQRAVGLHRQMRRQAEELAGRWHEEAALQDRYFTVRDDRYVLPVKSGDKRRVAGIVHGASRTGQTLYVEPLELVETGNDVAIAEAEVVEEELRLLRELSGEVAAAAGLLRDDLDVLFDFDVAWATAGLAQTLSARPAGVSGVGAGERWAPVELRRVRHPLLALAAAAGEGPEVVDNDLVLEPDTGALVITGPNTGGKTVLLKTLGLCTLMQRAGLPLPAADPSWLPLFDAVVGVIGDDQSLARARSTFSSHVETIAEGHDAAGAVAAAGGRALVLLDELVADTDPRQGGALAQAIVEAFLGQGARVVVTTHHEGLKAAASVRAGWDNAAVGFDVASQQPTYRLRPGVPGSSNPFEVAGRYGLSEAVLERARELAAGDADSLLSAIDSLEEAQEEARQTRERAEAAREEAEEARRAADETRRALEAEREGLEADKRTVLANARRKAERGLREAVDEARAVIARLQRGGMREAVEGQRELQRRLDALAEAEPDVATPSGAGEGTLEAGARVRVLDLAGVVGEVVEVDGDRAEALVLVGVARSRFPVARLEPVAGAAPSTSAGRWSRDAPASGDRRTSRCRLLGMRADEALTAVEVFLDRAFRQDLPEVVIVHGHGTGRLKQVVRDYLRDAPYVASFRRGGRGEGGDGVTVVELK